MEISTRECTKLASKNINWFVCPRAQLHLCTHTSASATGSGSGSGSGSAYGIGSPNYQWTNFSTSLFILFNSFTWHFVLLTTYNTTTNKRKLFDNILNASPNVLSTDKLMIIEWWSLYVRRSYLYAKSSRFAMQWLKHLN